GMQGLSERDGTDEVACGHVSGLFDAAAWPLALMESADRGLISLPGSKSDETLQVWLGRSVRPTIRNIHQRVLPSQA
ncbi:MAG TPA: hypothetical protein VMF91_12180, partial [Bryobacteraceae bacterium]|nr:hypothetical protein [Bryobacteraceae bacterium]